MTSVHFAGLKWTRHPADRWKILFLMIFGCEKRQFDGCDDSMTTSPYATPLDLAESLRTDAWRALPEDSRDHLGQFFTPARLARLIASRLNLDQLSSTRPIRILDCGAGVGSLGVSLIERIVRELPGQAIELTAIELHPDIAAELKTVQTHTLNWAVSSGISLRFDVLEVDFIEWASKRGSLFESAELSDVVIMNPPYAKIPTQGRYRRLTAQAACDVTNLYAAFVALGAEGLRDGGRLVAITPRSFTNGPYFRPFRQFLNQRMGFETVDLFESRSTLFADSDVLQENVVYSMVRGPRPIEVRLYFHGRDGTIEKTSADYSSFMPQDDPELFIFLRNGEEDHETARRINTLPCQLEDLGVSISTGRVVAFRSRQDLRQEPDEGSAPLLYPHHLRGGKVTWPQKSKKPNAIALNDRTQAMLFPSGDYVAVKRFTTKEERRRVVPTWVASAAFDSPHVGFENHLNVFHAQGYGIERDLAVGLTLYLRSTTVDTYFRQFSGHTQVNATDLRSVRYPDPAALRELGDSVDSPASLSQDSLDELLDATIWSAG
jgi:adenine-specific DNA-methyltransferase